MKKLYALALPPTGLVLLSLWMISFPPVAHAQFTPDEWGGAVGWSCPPNPKANSYAITSVSRRGNTAIVTLSGPTVIQPGEWITISGTTPDSGSFNTAPNTVWTVAAVSNPDRSTVRFAQQGERFSTTPTGGTLTEAFWYIAKVGSRWMECTPAGNTRWHAGIYEIDHTSFPGGLIAAKYGSEVAWAQQAIKRVAAWGFNSLFYTSTYAWPSAQGSSFYSDHHITNMFTANAGFSTIRNRVKEPPNQIVAPQAPKSVLQAQDKANGYAGWYGSATQDPFDPNYLIYLDRYWKSVQEHTYDGAGITNPWMEFAQSDDSDYNWGVGAGNDIPVPLSQPAGHWGYLALSAMPNLYGNWYFGVGWESGDTTVFAKREILEWLQGRGNVSYTMVRAAACDGSGNAETLTFDANPFNTGDSVWVDGITPADLNVSYRSPVTVSAATATTITIPNTCSAGKTAKTFGMAASNATKVASAVRHQKLVTLTFANHNPYHAGNANVDGDVLTLKGMTPGDFNTPSGQGARVLSSTPTSLTFAQNAPDETATELGTASAGPGYQSIADLNKAWRTRSYYTTFGTTGTTKTGVKVGTGEGDTTTFEVSIRDLVDRGSLRILVDGRVVADDEGSGYVYGPGLVPNAAVGCNCAIINYGTTTTLTLTLQKAPANGAPITASYTTGGYGHGTGLEDENGSHVAWLGTRSGNLPSRGGPGVEANPGVATDLDHFLYHYAYMLYNTDIEGIRKYARRGMLAEGIDSLNGHNGVTRKQIMLAASQNADVLAFSSGDAANRQTILDDMYRAVGDFPMLAVVFSLAQPDSSFYRTPNAAVNSGGVFTADTQEERGKLLADEIKWLLNARPTGTSSTFPVMGYNLWEYADNAGENSNWGLVSLADNAYDASGASGPTYAKDLVTGLDNTCPRGPRCEAGRLNFVNYHGGYMVIFFSPHNAPAAGANITVDYSLGGYRIRGERIATGDGSTRGFSHSFSNRGMIDVGSIIVKVNGVQVATDNGSGGFIGANVDGPEAHGDAVTPIKNANAAWHDLIPSPARAQGAPAGANH